MFSPESVQRLVQVGIFVVALAVGMAITGVVQAVSF